MKKKIFTAEELQIDTEASPFVFVDYLAFSFPYSSLRHAHKSDLSNPCWAPLPKPTYQRVRCPKRKEKLEDLYRSKWRVAMLDRLQVFCLHVLGLKMSPWRDKGLNGYENSCHLTPKHSRQHVGFVALLSSIRLCFACIGGCSFLIARSFRVLI